VWEFIEAFPIAFACINVIFFDILEWFHYVSTHKPVFRLYHWVWGFCVKLTMRQVNYVRPAGCLHTGNGVSAVPITRVGRYWLVMI